MSYLQAQGLVKRFPGGAGLSGVDLSVEPGELLALLGPSGCGKTTLLRGIAGLTQPDAGRVLIGGQDVTTLPPERRGAVMLFQQPLLFPHLTAAENVGFSLGLRGLSRRETVQRSAEALAWVALTGFADRYPDQLSGGQQQRVALARALVAAPRVLLLDEPFSALDAPLRAEMRELLRTLQRRFAITVLFVTHDQEEASLLGDRLAVMSGGQLLQVGTAADLYYRPASLGVAEFFGHADVIAGHVHAGYFHCALGVWPVRRPPSPEGREGDSPETLATAPGPALAVIRPEQVLLDDAADAVRAQVRESRFAGGQWLVRLQAGSHSLQARLPGAPTLLLRPGQDVGIRVQGPLWCLPGAAAATTQSDRLCSAEDGYRVCLKSTSMISS